MANNKSPIAYTGKVLASTQRAGMTQMDSDDFTVTDGKTSLSGTGAMETLTGDSGTGTPVAGNVKIAGGEAITTTGSGAQVSVAVTDESVTQTKFDVNYVHAKFRDPPVSMQSDGTATSGTDTEVNNMHVGDGIMFEYSNIGTQTLLVPTISATGLLISRDLTDDEGTEYSLGVTARSRCAFTAQTNACFVQCTVTFADASGVDPFYIGFRKVEPYDAAIGNYTDYFCLGVEGTSNPNTIQFQTNLNAGGAATTDTTDTWADAASKTIRINVSAAGIATGLIDGASPTTEPATFTFDADTIIPFVYFLHGTTSPGAITITDFKCGLQ